MLSIEETFQYYPISNFHSLKHLSLEAFNLTILFEEL